MTSTARAIPGFDPQSRDFLIDPSAALQELLRETPVFYHRPLDTYYVLPYEEVRRVILDDRAYSSRVFKTMPVRDDLRHRGGCDVMADYASQLTLRVVTSMMNVPQDLVPGFQAWMASVLGLTALIDLRPEDVTTPDDELAETYERVYAAYRTYSAFLAERRANPGDDLVSAMLAVTGDDGRPVFTADEVLGHMVELTAAGTDTSANIIVNLVRLFTEHPEQLKLVLAEPELWDNAVQEGLRRYAPATQIFRICREDSEIAGVRIPAGSRLGLSLPAANADPAKFPDPLRFDVRRANAGDHLTFGRGRHFCLGSPLARPEARIAVERLYQRLPDLRADLDQPLAFIPALTIRAITSQRAMWGA